MSIRLAHSAALGGASTLLASAVMSNPIVATAVGLVAGAIGHGVARLIDAGVAWAVARLKANAKAHGEQLDDEDRKP